MQKRLLFPSAFSLLRIAALPLLLYFFYNGNFGLSLVVFSLCGATDLVDGYVARKLKVNSELGAFVDATADFILTLGTFMFFAAEGFYPFWIPVLIVFMFAQFVFSSLYSKRLYDPVGKYYGSLLYASVSVTLAFPTHIVCLILVVTITGCTAISVLSRIAYFLGIFPQQKNIQN